MNYLNKQRKRFKNICMSFLIFVGSALMMVACDSSTDSSRTGSEYETSGLTLRLVSYEGQVSVENAIGSDITAKEDMQLRNGYVVETSETSYAYISLDDSKVIKLDEKTSLSVKQVGERLEVLLDYGQMFFHVSSPLEDSETMNIRTSNMVTGIRGTAGYVSAQFTEEGHDSSVAILEGKTEVSYLDAVNGEGIQEMVVAGQVAHHISTENDVTIDFYFETGSADEIPDFVREEISKDKELQDKIEQEGAFSIDDLMDDDDNDDEDDNDNDDDDNDDEDQDSEDDENDDSDDDNDEEIETEDDDDDQDDNQDRDDDIDNNDDDINSNDDDNDRNSQQEENHNDDGSNENHAEPEEDDDDDDAVEQPSPQPQEPQQPEPQPEPKDDDEEEDDDD